MTVTVEFSTRTSRNSYVVENVKKTEQTDTCLVVFAEDEILRFPWTSIAWTRTDLR